jgi:ribosomal protein L21
MFAIIKTGGKQISVKVGDEIFVEKLPVWRRKNKFTF